MLIRPEQTIKSDKLSINLNLGWHRTSSEWVDIYVRGYAFNNTKLLSNIDLAIALLAIVKIEKNVPEIFNLLKHYTERLNGAFAIVVKAKDNLFTAVDYVRSIPLFYTQKSDTFFLSDNASMLTKQLDDVKLDTLASDEFLLTGYITEDSTLLPKVKQLRAGECLCVLSNNEGFKINKSRYFGFLHTNLNKLPNEEIISLYEKTLINTFKRLVQSAKNRTLVVPLSGGLDSRLIVSVLKMLGANNVICFSYGKYGNWESQTSQRIAKKLGYKWKFIPYTPSTWTRFFETKIKDDYFAFANNLCSIPHFGDFPAVYTLKDLKLIPESAIFVPGHTGDFICGGHIPIEFNKKKLINETIIVNTILRDHYSLWNWDKQKSYLYPYLHHRVATQIGDLAKNTPEEAANSYEYWAWQERQAKFIVNAVRVYEFLGYEWRLPLWDKEMVSFWMDVPYNLRLQSRLYKKYLYENLFKKFNIGYYPRNKNTIARLIWNLPRKIQLLFYKSILHYESLYKYAQHIETKFFAPANIHSYTALYILEYLKNVLQRKYYEN